MSISEGEYQSTPDTLQAGQTHGLELDSQGNLKVAGSFTTTPSGTQNVQGNVASGAADSGNPVKIGGVYNSSAPTFSNGQRADTQVNSKGAIKVDLVISDGATSVISSVDSNQDSIVAAVFRLGTGSLRYGFNGSTWDRVRIPNIFKPLSTVSIATETTVWTPTSGKKFRLMGGVITASVAGNITFKDNTAGTTIFVVPVTAGVPVSIPQMGNGILSAAANNVLTATGPAASTLSGTLFGIEE